MSVQRYALGMAADLSVEVLKEIRDGVIAMHAGLDQRMGRMESRLDETVVAFSKMFTMVDRRLSGVEDGQNLVVERLDRLVNATTRDRTEQIERLARLEQRVETLEGRS